MRRGECSGEALSRVLQRLFELTIRAIEESQSRGSLPPGDPSHWRDLIKCLAMGAILFALRDEPMAYDEPIADPKLIMDELFELLARKTLEARAGR